jgi:hypothetical protein
MTDRQHIAAVPSTRLCSVNRSFVGIKLDSWNVAGNDLTA